MHLGHQALIKKTLQCARVENLKPALVTFYPHPRVILGGAKLAPLTGRSRKLALLREQGIEHIVEMPFTAELANLSPEEFACSQLLPLGVKSLVIGHDFALGKDRKGTIRELSDLGEKLGFKTHQANALLLDGEPVSSTRLRKLLAAGDAQGAARLLGRWPRVCGSVGRGFKRGREIGFPTANLENIEEVLPAGGVYATFAEFKGNVYPAVTNIGCNPTFNGSKLTVESFLLEGAPDLYNQDLCLDFVARLRSEKTFPTPVALAAQISEDVICARAILDKAAAFNPQITLNEATFHQS